MKSYNRRGKERYHCTIPQVNGGLWGCEGGNQFSCGFHAQRWAKMFSTNFTMSSIVECKKKKKNPSLSKRLLSGANGRVG